MASVRLDPGSARDDAGVRFGASGHASGAAKRAADPGCPDVSGAWTPDVHLSSAECHRHGRRDGSDGRDWDRGERSDVRGTGSGVQGAILATGYSDLLGQSVASGECVALVQATSDVGLTGTWVPGDQVEGNTNLAPGTAIATFGSDGTYTNTYGQSHAAIYLGQDQTGIYVEDQWLGHAASTRVIPWTTSNSYELGSKFYVITHG